MYNDTTKRQKKMLHGVRRRVRGRVDGGDVTNVQYKPNWNFHYESPLYNEYILIKIFKKEKNAAKC
jgi:hypothetical protein